MAGQYHGIPIRFSSSSNDNSAGHQFPLHPAGASGFNFYPTPQHGVVPNQQVEEGSSSASKKRGRPLGSKNKPKPQTFITQHPHDIYGFEYSMWPTVIDVGEGFDVMEAIVQVAHRNNAGVFILDVAGIINKVTIGNTLNQAFPYTLYGPFVVLSLSGSYMTPDPDAGFPYAPMPPFIPNLPPSAIPSSFGIRLISAQGNVFCGNIAGKVMAASQGVTMIALLFRKPEFHKFGVFEGDIVEEDIDNEDGGAGGDHTDAGGSGGGAGVGSSSAPTFVPHQAPVSMGYGGAMCSGSGARASSSDIHASGSALTPMGYGGASGSGSGACASGIRAFGPAPTPMINSGASGSGNGTTAVSSRIPSFDLAPVGYGGATTCGTSASASGARIPIFRPTTVAAPDPMGYGIASGSSSGASVSGSDIPVFGSGLIRASAPMGYDVPTNPNAMHWGRGHLGAHPPNY